MVPARSRSVRKKHADALFKKDANFSQNKLPIPPEARAAAQNPGAGIKLISTDRESAFLVMDRNLCYIYNEEKAERFSLVLRCAPTMTRIQIDPSRKERKETP